MCDVQVEYSWALMNRVREQKENVCQCIGHSSSSTLDERTKCKSSFLFQPIMLRINAILQWRNKGYHRNLRMKLIYAYIYAMCINIRITDPIYFAPKYAFVKIIIQICD